jgi:hypothetical protein
MRETSAKNDFELYDLNNGMNDINMKWDEEGCGKGIWGKHLVFSLGEVELETSLRLPSEKEKVVRYLNLEFSTNVWTSGISL